MAGITDVTHGKAVVNGVRLHYVTAGDPSRHPVVLVHGFPETSHQWRHVIPALAEKYFVIAPDYRGAGGSDKPATGYDKQTMSQDVYELIQLLAPGRTFSLVGHDMGAFVSFPLVANHTDEVASFVLLDAPLLGTPAWDSLQSNPRVWHVHFHGAVDVAETLVAGRERYYLTQFFENRAYHPHKIVDDVEEYIRQYSMAGAIRAAFSAYRALPSDADWNRELFRTFTIPMPFLVVAGGYSNSGRTMIPMVEKYAVNGRFEEVAESGHWISEEQPERLVELLLDFLPDPRS
jgi:pimeloyl-ACP methyl ester carboxylesterase